MKIVFISNYLNHHQLPLCLEFYNHTCGEFWFVATSSITKERLSFGYSDMNKSYSWVVRAYENSDEKAKAMELIFNADVVIWGDAPSLFVKKRLKKDKLTFKYSERIYKRKQKWYELIIRFVQHFVKYKRYRNLYMLCASMFTATDYAKTNTFVNKCFKWGYFPEIKKIEEVGKLIGRKQDNSIIWAGRFIDVKHPEYAVLLAERLRRDNFDFSITMVGDGILLNEIRKEIEDKGLQDKINLIGAVPAEEVRTFMENSEIFIFTSDRNEGWGAVLNEAMNSACACVCDNKIGSTGFLIKDGQNGVLYEDSNFDDFYQKVVDIIKNEELRKTLSINAYTTMEIEWNAVNAVEKFLMLCENYNKKSKIEFLFESGVLSKAE